MISLPSTPWLKSVIDGARSEAHALYLQYTATAEAMKNAHVSLTTSIRRYVASEAQTTREMQSILATLDSVNITKLRADLVTMQSELNLAISSYQSTVVANNDLAAVIRNNYIDSQAQLDSILTSVAALQKQIQSTTGFIDEYKRLMA